MSPIANNPRHHSPVRTAARFAVGFIVYVGIAVFAYYMRHAAIGGQ